MVLCKLMLLIGLGVAVLATGAWTAMATEPLKIGVAGAHSGDLASYGLPTLKAVTLVVKDVNARGGIKGQPLEVVAEDDACKPEVAANTATKLVTAGVRAVIGHTCSGATNVALKTYLDAKLTVISPSATTPELTQGAYPNFYRTIASNDAQAKLLVDFVLHHLKAGKVAILHDKGEYGKGLAEYARTFLVQNQQAEMVLFEGITPGAVDYSAVIQKVKRAKAEAVIFGGYHPEASKLVSQMRQKRIDIPFVSDDGVKDETFIKVAGTDAEGVYASGPADVSRNPLTREYREKFRQTEGTEPGAFFDNAVAAALVLTHALAKAQDPTLPAMAEVLHTEEVATPFGQIKFDTHGEPIGIGFTMYRVQNGVYVQVQ